MRLSQLIEDHILSNSVIRDPTFMLTFTYLESTVGYDTIQYDTIEEFNVDLTGECGLVASLI